MQKPQIEARMTSPYADLAARLRTAIVTASNDAQSWMGTKLRERHIARLKAMEDAADALSRPVTEEMVERGARVLWTAFMGRYASLWEDAPPEYKPEYRRSACAILTAALGTPAAGHETYPGHDPAAGLPQPDTGRGACPVCSRVLSMNRTLAKEFAAAMGLAIEEPDREASIRAEATAAERERCLGIVDRFSDKASFSVAAITAAEVIAAAIRGGRE